MILGRGLLGTALRKIDREDVVFYANGVSNSTIQCNDDGNFEEKEIRVIAKNTKAARLIYFSTIQVNAPENFERPYVIHKIKMENLVRQLFADHVIIRTSNIIGNNPWNYHTLFNYLFNSLKEEKKINVVESASRNVLDVDHFIQMVNHYIIHYQNENTTVNMVNTVSYEMFEILTAFEKIFKRKFRKDYTKINIAKFAAPCQFSAKLILECEIELDNYLENVIKKYYPPFPTDPVV